MSRHRMARIEVKCSAYLQSWAQRRLSSLSFGRLSGREFDEASHQYTADARYRADVFVFPVQAQQEPDAYDMLDLARWESWVASAHTICQQGLKTVGIGWVHQHAAGPLPYGELAGAIHTAAAGTA